MLYGYFEFLIMRKVGKIKKNKRLKASILSMLFVFSSFVIIAPKILTYSSSGPLQPDQFIGEILPNQTSILKLLKSNAVITINSTNYPDIIGIEFNANYTIYSPENGINLSLILPFSLGIQIDKANFNVKLNETQIEFDLYNFTDRSINDTENGLDFSSIFLIHNPIILITCNFTTLENESYTIGYKFNGVLNNPLVSQDVLTLAYYLNTSKIWLGNTTGRVEFQVYGKNPTFFTMGNSFVNINPQILNTLEGKSCIWDWTNIKIDTSAIGIVYDETHNPDYGFWISIILNIIFYTIIVSVIIFVIIRRKSRKVTD